METLTIISEILLTLTQAYMLAAKQAGMDAETAKQTFLDNYDKFMEESSVPVDPVKED